MPDAVPDSAVPDSNTAGVEPRTGLQATDAVALIARRLHRAGCRHAFGIPGGEVLAMMNALDQAGIAFTLCKHENAGGFMAEGAHHATGAPGILLATIGPGIANGINTVANALQDQVPLIVLSGCVDAAEAARYTHQVFDHAALMRPIVKASLRAADGAVDLIADKAVSIATADPQGPVHIDIPIGLARKPQAQPRRALIPPTGPTAPARGPMLDEARELLAKARRPVMLAGVGAMHHGAASWIGPVCERFGMPLLTSYKGKGLLAEDHPLALGGHGLSPRSDALVQPLVEKADFVLSVGYDPIEMRPGWRDLWDPSVCVELVHLPSLHGMHGAAMSFVGHVAEGLKTLTDGVDPQGETWPDGEPAALRAALRAAFADRPEWGPHAIFHAARRASPADTVVSVDSGAHRILFSQIWQTPFPRALIQSSALCTMGCALPLAIGHKLAKPGAPMLSVIGDACLEMTLGELATLRDIELPVAVMVLVDRSLALIELKQRGGGYANLGVDFAGTDFAAVAEALGGVGVNVTDATTLERELAAAYGRETFTLLACHIDRKSYDGAI